MKNVIWIRYTFFIVLLCFNSVCNNCAYAERYTMEHIEQLNNILDKATSKTLVIFDVDEVIVYPTNLIQLQPASPFWEAKMADIEKRLGKDKRDLLHSIMLLQSRWELIDATLPQIINTLQSRNIQVLALTSFRTGKMGKIQSIEDWRRQQLKNHNIDFKITAGISKSYFEINGLENSDGTKKPVYKDGIIYTDLQSKSVVLNAFLAHNHLNPNEIIFIDDRISNVEDLESFCNKININFIGIHDNRLLTKHPHFDPNLGQFQFFYLENHHVWLNDREAKEKMLQTPTNNIEVSREDVVN